MKSLLRIELQEESFFEMLWDLLMYQAPNTHIPSMLLSLFCIKILLVIKLLKRKYRLNRYIRYIPSALVIVVIGTGVSYYTRGAYHFSIIGVLDCGLPQSANLFQHVSFSAFINLFPSSALISVIAFCESYSMAKDLADKRGYTVEPSQELIAYGLSNMTVSFFRGFVTAGSVSRTAI
eukprot:16382_1